MDKKIERLRGKGMFKNTSLNKLGHGTFKMSKGVVGKSKCMEISEAMQLKRRSLALMESDIKEAKKCQMEFIFAELRVIQAMDKGKDVASYINKCKSLCRHIEELVTLYNSAEHPKFLSSLKYALFNIKFHYLSLEGNLMQRSIKSAKRFNTKHFLYFLGEYQSLNHIFLESPLEDFVIARLENLEETMKSRMRIGTGLCTEEEQ